MQGFRILQLMSGLYAETRTEQNHYSNYGISANGGLTIVFTWQRTAQCRAHFLRLERFYSSFVVVVVDTRRNGTPGS